MGKRLIINPGMKFNRLTIIREKSYKPPGGVRRRVFLCQCSCKNKTHLAVGLYDLTSGHTKSCGCYKQEIHTTHGVSDHPLYMVYFDMIDRCYNKNHQAYKNYGGRKIRVCLKWRLKIKYRGLKNFVYWAENNGWKKGL